MNQSVHSDDELIALLERTMRNIAQLAPEMSLDEVPRHDNRWVARTAAAVIVVAGAATTGIVLSNQQRDPGPVDTVATTAVHSPPTSIRLGGGGIVWPPDELDLDRSTPEAVAERFGADVLGFASLSVDSSGSGDLTSVVNVSDTRSPSQVVSLHLRRFPIGWAIEAVGQADLTLSNSGGSSILTFAPPAGAARVVLTWRSLDTTYVHELTAVEIAQGLVTLPDIVTVGLLISYDQSNAVLDAAGGAFNNVLPTTPSTTTET